MSNNVTPIPLPMPGQNPLNPGIITGWGWGTSFTFSPSLKFIVLPLADGCRSEYGDVLTPTVDDSMFCTGPLQFGQNVCFGDSGSALVVKDPDTEEIYAAGILSYDKPCRSNKYAVYMKLTAYLPWIHSVIRGDTEESAAERSKAIKRMFSLQQ